jgi:rubrerythrin
MSSRDSLAAAAGRSTEADVRILNTALGAELEAIAAYQVGAESGLLQKPVLDLAVTFQGHHKEHADVLAKTIAKLGGRAVAAKAKYAFPTETLKSQADVLRFAATLEKGAVSAYLGAVPVFGDRDLAKAAASILGDEAMHWAILRNALGEAPVPAAFVS